MTAATAKLLTLEEYRMRYAGRKPNFEYWDGKAVQKSRPTWMHGLIQRIVGSLLAEAGYFSGSEVELRIVDNWQPVPDVVAASTVEHPYPTKPVEVAVEIFSPDDRMDEVRDKCRRYTDIGIKQVFVVDPDHRGVMQWDMHLNRLVMISQFDFLNGVSTPVSDLWKRLDEELRRVVVAKPSH